MVVMLLSLNIIFLIIKCFILLNYQSTSLSISSIQSSIFNIINRNQHGLLSKLIPKSIKQIIGHQPSYIYLSIKKLISNFYSIEYEEDCSVKDEIFLSLLRKASKYCSRIYDHHQLFMKPYSLYDKDQVSNNNLNKTIILSVDKYNYTDCMVVFQATQSNLNENNDVTASSTSSINDASIVDVDIWVVIRGTSTKLDFLLDLSWLLTTKSIGNYNIPVLLSIKVQSILPKLIKAIHDYTIVNKEYRLKKKIYFTGHSLGGAMATALYLYYQTTLESLQMTGEVFTFGSPLVLASLPSSQWNYQQRSTDTASSATSPSVLNSPLVRRLPNFYRIASYLSQQATTTSSSSSSSSNAKILRTTNSIGSLSSVMDFDDDYHNPIVIDSMTLACRIHNVVNELDPIPRLLGNYPLPAYLPLSNNYLTTTSSSSSSSTTTTTSSSSYDDATNTINSIETTSNNMINKNIINNNIRFSRNIISMISQSLHGRIRQIRKYYQPFGKYYLLVPPHKATAAMDVLNKDSDKDSNKTIDKGDKQSKKDMIRTKYILWEDRNILSNELPIPGNFTSLNKTNNQSINLSTSTTSNNNNNNSTNMYHTTNSIMNSMSSNQTLHTILDFFPIDMPGFVNCILTQHDIKSTVQRLHSL